MGLEDLGLRRETDRGPALLRDARRVAKLGRPDSGVKLDEADVGRVFREEFGRSVAALVRAFGDIDVAEDAVQEAFAVALARWPREGLPPNPGGWITTTARNRGIDRLRRESRGRELLAMVIDDAVPTSVEEHGPVQDDRLRL